MYPNRGFQVALLCLGLAFHGAQGNWSLSSVMWMSVCEKLGISLLPNLPRSKIHSKAQVLIVVFKDASASSRQKYAKTFGIVIHRVYYVFWEVQLVLQLLPRKGSSCMHELTVSSPEVKMGELRRSCKICCHARKIEGSSP